MTQFNGMIVTSWVWIFITIPITRSKFMVNNGLDNEKPIFENVIKNLSVPIGRDATFTCVVSGLSKYKVGWVKADSKAIQAIGSSVITHNHRVSVSGDFHTTFNLHITAVEMEDGGNYMCQINTDPMTSQSGWLNVMIPPDIDMSETSSDIVVREHQDNARLVCRANGVPKPRIKWRREGGQRIRTRVKHQHRMVKEVDNSTLVLHKVRREDMGAYLCIASNDVPPAVSRRVYLHVQFSPAIVTTNQILGSSVGHQISMECVVEAYPKPFTVWSIKDKILISSGEEGYHVTETAQTMYSVISRLTLHNYTDYQAGNYKCKATNSLGHAESSVRLYTSEMPKELIPRKEPKYDIIVEEEDVVEIRKPSPDREHQVQHGSGGGRRPVYTHNNSRKNDNKQHNYFPNAAANAPKLAAFDKVWIFYCQISIICLAL